MVDSVGYDQERRLLQVMFTSGRVYCYEDVPPEVFQGLLEANPKGSICAPALSTCIPTAAGRAGSDEWFAVRGKTCLTA